MITEEVLRLLMESEKRGVSTSRTAKDIAKGLLKHFMTRLDLELESVANTAVAIDFDGDIATLDRYRKAVRRTRDHMKAWVEREAAAMEEGA